MNLTQAVVLEFGRNVVVPLLCLVGGLCAARRLTLVLQRRAEELGARKGDR